MTAAADGLTGRMVALGLADLQARMVAEVDGLCGPRGARNGSSLVRYGSARGRVVILGRWVAITRPRVRDRVTGREVPLQSYLHASARQTMTDAVMRLAADGGVSTRGYAGALEPIDAPARGVSRSSVSRHLVVGMQARAEQFAARTHQAGVTVPVLALDGLGVGGTTFMVATALTSTGQRVLAAVEHAQSETGDLVAKTVSGVVNRFGVAGVPLVISDGGAGITAGLADVLPSAQRVRCREHRLDNVLSSVPRELRELVKSTLHAAWSTADYDTARGMLGATGAELASAGHDAAARIVLDGCEDTLTLNRLGLQAAWGTVLGTNNGLESMFGGVRRYARRVTRWRDAGMRERWTLAALLDAERRTRRVPTTHMDALLDATSQPAPVPVALRLVRGEQHITASRGARGTHRTTGQRGAPHAA